MISTTEISIFYKPVMNIDIITLASDSIKYHNIRRFNSANALLSNVICKSSHFRMKDCLKVRRFEAEYIF